MMTFLAFAKIFRSQIGMLLLACFILACTENVQAISTSTVIAGGSNNSASKLAAHILHHHHPRITYVPIKPPPPAAPVPPVAAPDLSINDQPGAAILTWTPVSNAHIYRIMRSNKMSEPYVVLQDNLSATVSAYTDTGVKIGINYYYEVSAVHDGLSLMSMPKAYYIAPPPPTGGVEIKTDMNADIVVDGKDTGVGNGDVTIKPLSLGQHTFTVSAPGYHPQTFTLAITDAIDVKTVDMYALTVAQPASPSTVPAGQP
jgi:hypothetical protein